VELAQQSTETSVATALAQCLLLSPQLVVKVEQTFTAITLPGEQPEQAITLNTLGAQVLTLKVVVVVLV
jgi:hypothetical protein